MFNAMEQPDTEKLHAFESKLCEVKICNSGYDGLAVSTMIEISPFLTIPDSEILLSYVRASGPGGQNVNKVSTACELRFDARSSLSLPADIAVRLMKLAGRRLTKDGVIVISADRFRSQEQNREDATKRLKEMILEAAKPPPPKRLATKPSRSATERRLKSKTVRAGVKKLRNSRLDSE
jgi:ribosome-associated protein